ncbi:MAG TPA: hypothetical protein PKA19_07955 [Bacillota bacterium]|nr:hypothetical protein [Bacillota bacterium]
MYGKEALKGCSFRLGEYELGVIDGVPDEKARRWFRFHGPVKRSEKLRYIIRQYESMCRRDADT